MASNIRLARRSLMLYVRDIIVSGDNVPVVEGYTLLDNELAVPSIALWIARRGKTKYNLGGGDTLYTYDCVIDIFPRTDGERDTLGGRIIEALEHSDTMIAVPTTLATAYDANPGSKYGDLIIEHDSIRATPARMIGSGNVGRRHQKRIQFISTLIKD